MSSPEMRASADWCSPFPAGIAFARARAATAADLLPEEALDLSPRAVEKRRQDFQNGRLAAGRCLLELGEPRTPIRSGSDRAPVWPPGILGSITHSGGMALAAAARRSDWSAIGLDLEHLSGVRRLAIADRIADPTERAWIGTSRRRLMAVFSAKEAIFKALYPAHQAWFGFEAVTLRRTDSGFDAIVCQPLDRPVGSVVPVGVRWHEDAVLTWVALRAE
jgi:4'-phosphopantetheinyl transferase EntD